MSERTNRTGLTGVEVRYVIVDTVESCNVYGPWIRCNEPWWMDIVPECVELHIVEQLKRYPQLVNACRLHYDGSTWWQFRMIPKRPELCRAG